MLSFNQWKNSDMVIKWFSSIKIKSQCAFIQLGIMKFYPSITETILDNALSFAKQHVEISDKDLRIIKHCRKSLFYHENEARKKKNSDDCFDVTMGSYDGAETCELVGTLVLSTLVNSIPKENCGLFRGSGLFLMRNENGHKTDRISKEVIKYSKRSVLN